jgi:serine/threonine protein kinase
MSPTTVLVAPFSTVSLLRLTDGTSLSLQIIKPFLPFTKSQVFLVRPEPPGCGLPSELILKVFDPRYLDDRIPPPKSGLPSRLWTLEAETAAADYRQEIAEGKRPDDFSVDLLYGDEEAEPYLWEEHFYRLLKESWESEADALSRLASLQGTVIPMFYGSGNVVPPASTRGIQPRAILMEYIHGTPLADIEVGKVNLPPAIFRPLLDAVKRFGDLGVFHSDINHHNVLVSPPEAPTRAVLIDFGCAGVRQDDESEEEWIRNVEFFDDERSLRRLLDKKGMIVGVDG